MTPAQNAAHTSWGTMQGTRASYGRNPSPPRAAMYAAKRAGSLVGAGTGLVRRSSSVAEGTASLVCAHILLHWK